MAIWQFRVDLVPRSALLRVFGDVPVTLTKDFAEGTNWWGAVPEPKGLEEAISAILPRAESWSEHVGIWGDEGSDTISICYDDSKRVEAVSCRVDLRECQPWYVTAICELAEKIECVLLTATGQLIEPRVSEVTAAIGTSTAERFVTDPAETLRQMKPRPGAIVPMRNGTEDEG